MTTHLPSRTSLEALYRSAEYLIGTAPRLNLRIDAPAPLLDQLLREEGAPCAALLTAYNPGSRMRAAAENENALQRMQQQLFQAGVRTLPALGRDTHGSWPDEAGVLALGITLPVATATATAFGQLAFVWCAVGKPPRLIWTD